ncbi:MAG TPA: MFS transporter [Nitrososphaeraceae archaeon]|nr:MFS transporter [Nitrososphaeraceae archaeon]
MVDEKKTETNSTKNTNKPPLPSSASSPEPASSNTSGNKNTISTSAWITLAILGSSILITMYGETMLLPAIPEIITEFNISYNTASWILTAYLIAGAVMTPIAGKLSDIYGRKKMVLIIMIIYIIGISLGGLSSNIIILIISRLIQGIGISMFPIAFGIVRDQFPPEKLAIGVGTFSAMFAAGSVVGLAIGGSIIQYFGWRNTFFSIIPIAILLWFIIKRFIYDHNTNQHYLIQFSPSEKSTSSSAAPSEQKQGTNVNSNNNNNDLEVVTTSTKSIDIKGAITLAIIIISFLIVFSYLGTGSSSSSSSSSDGRVGEDRITTPPIQIIIGFLITGIISLILFITIEKRTKSPLIDFKLLSNKIILPANILLLISFLAMFTVYQTIPILVTSPAPVGGLEGDALTTANIQLPFMIVFLLFAPSSGFIISRLGNIKPTLIGSIISTIGFFSILLFHSTESMVAGTLAIIATGLSLTQVGGFNTILESTPRQFSGISLGMTVLLNLIGGAVGPAIAGIYMQTNQVFINGSFYPSLQSYNLIFLTATLLSLVSIVLVLIIRKRSTSSSSLNSQEVTMKKA